MGKVILDYFVPGIAYFVFRKCHPTWQLPEHEVADYD